MNDRTLRNDAAANMALWDARAVASVQRARPLVRRSAWQEFKPQSPGEATACWWLGLVIFIEFAVLAYGIWSR